MQKKKKNITIRILVFILFTEIAALGSILFAINFFKNMASDDIHQPSVSAMEIATPEQSSQSSASLEPSSAQPLETPATISFTRKQHDESLKNTANAINLNVNVVYQLPELPTGCEITSLTMALNYYGYNVSKETMADNYLEKGEIGVDSYKKVFLGNPREKYALGCYAPVIVNSANKYLSENNSTMRAFNLSGSELSALYEEVRYGNPVIIWGSLNPDVSINYTSTWIADGEILKWPANEHCMLLTGFNLETNTVIICDPLKGTVEYDYSAFLEYYIELGKQAVVIDYYN